MKAKYLKTGTLFTAIRDLVEYNIKEGDLVKISGTELDGGDFGLINLRTKEDIRMNSLEFMKNFK